MGYTDSHIDSRLECSETQSGGTSCIQMKTEPLGGPSSPESTSETNAHPDDCAGCGRSIQVSQVETETAVPFLLIFMNLFDIWARLIRFSVLHRTRIDSTFRQLKSDGMLGAFSAVCAGSYSKAKRHAFHVMEVFIANQITTGKPNVRGFFHLISAKHLQDWPLHGHEWDVFVCWDELFAFIERCESHAFTEPTMVRLRALHGFISSCCWTFSCQTCDAMAWRSFGPQTITNH